MVLLFISLCLKRKRLKIILLYATHTYLRRELGGRKHFLFRLCTLLGPFPFLISCHKTRQPKTLVLPSSSSLCGLGVCCAGQAKKRELVISWNCLHACACPITFPCTQTIHYPEPEILAAQPIFPSVDLSCGFFVFAVISLVSLCGE